MSVRLDVKRTQGSQHLKCGFTQSPSNLQSKPPRHQITIACLHRLPISPKSGCQQTNSARSFRASDHCHHSMPQVKTAMNDWVLLCYSVEQSRKQRTSTSAIKAECCSKPAVAAACSLQHAVLLEKASRRIGRKGYGSVEQLNKNALMHDKEPELPCICHISYTCSATSNNFAVLNDLQHLLDCGVQPFCSHAVDPRNEHGQA